MVRKALLPLVAAAVLAACGAPSSANSGQAGTPTTYGTSPTPSTTAIVTPTPTASPTPAPTAAPVPARAAPSIFVAQNMRLGAILANAQGRTLYYFVPERGGTIVCTGQCTSFWPPVFSATMAPTASPALPGQLGVISRTGGEQVTYNHWPLYTFTGDSGPDQTNGQGVFGFGGKWFVANPGLQP